LPSVSAHDAFRLAVPTDEHFIPLLYLAGLAMAAGEPASILVDGYAMGSLSMTSYTVGRVDVSDAPGSGDPAGQGGAPVLPDVPADETNL